MKKVSLICLIIAIVLLMTSCMGGGKGAADTTKKEADTTEKETTETVVDSRIDFSTVKVVQGIVAADSEDILPIAEGEADFYVSQTPSVAEVDSEGNVTVKGKGTTLIGYEIDGEQRACVICVPETSVDIASCRAAMVFEVGGSFMHSAPISADGYESSDPDVVNVGNAPRLTFEKEGYAYITVYNASRPFTYSFIVYDREA